MLHDVNNWRKYTCIAPLKSYNSIKFNIDKLFDGGQYKILRRYRGVILKVLKSRDFGRAVAVRRWTTTAIECYKRGCNCEGCFYTDFFNKSSQKCQMKASVLELVRVLGKPDVEIQQILQEE